MRLVLEKVIIAEQARVFRFFADPRNRPLWQRSLGSVTLQAAGKPRLGMRWHESPGGLVRVDVEITCFEPPKRWAERGVSRLGRLDLSLTFVPEEKATRVVLDAELELTWPLRSVSSLAKPLMAREMQHDLSQACQILEREGVRRA
jgi:uncharacterized protein YndB with AHSA1/START domain